MGHPFANTFIGIHLRTANDILSYWLGYDDQASYYIQRIKASQHLSSIPIMYIASGNATSVTSFTAEQEDALVQPKHVITKETEAGTCGFPKGWWKSKVLGTALRDEF